MRSLCSETGSKASDLFPRHRTHRQHLESRVPLSVTVSENSSRIQHRHGSICKATSTRQDCWFVWSTYRPAGVNVRVCACTVRAVWSCVSLALLLRSADMGSSHSIDNESCRLFICCHAELHRRNMHKAESTTQSVLTETSVRTRTR